MEKRSKIIIIVLGAILAIIAGVLVYLHLTEEEVDPTPVFGPIIDPVVEKKPIIYIYPEKETKLTIKLGHENRITESYPEYNGGWEVIAYPNGKLVDTKTNRELYALYWEGNVYENINFKDGFVVKGEDTVKFLEEKLEILGLNARESEEFIIYWAPILKQNKYNLIRFEELEKINEYMPLEISSKPDTLIRVLMEYKPLDKEINIQEQELTKATRSGFTIVEWGGVKVK